MPLEHWKTARLGEVSRIVLGQSPPSDTYTTNPKHTPFLQGKAEFTDLYPAPRRYCQQPAKIAKKGSVLISVRAPVGAVNLADQDYGIGRGVAAIEFPSGDAQFMLRQLQWRENAISSLGTGSTFEAISGPVLAGIQIMVPPLAEQSAVVRVLAATQHARDARRHEIELERERKTALLQHLFTHGTHGEPRKASEFGEIPESWRITQLGRISRIMAGGTPDRQVPEYWNGDIPWVKTGEINYRVITSTGERITQAGLESSAARIFPAGTLLIAMYGQGVTRGRVAILGIEAATNQACAAILLDQDVDTGYLYQYLSHAYESIRSLAHGANQQNLSSTLLRTIPVPLAPLDEQGEIAAALSGCDAKIAALEREIALHDELFRAQLEELMSGRLSVSPLLENAAA